MPTIATTIITSSNVNPRLRFTAMRNPLPLGSAV
jgi:hypothetical protein